MEDEKNFDVLSVENGVATINESQDVTYTKVEIETKISELQSLILSNENQITIFQNSNVQLAADCQRWQSILEQFS